MKKILIIAEISANHGRNINNAVSLIKKAKDCGVDAVKFQCYTPDTMTIDADNSYFRIKHSRWGGQTLYQLYKKAYTPWVWFKRLKGVADDSGLIFFATAFDKTSVDFLEEIGVPFHKIASFEITDLPLIEHAAKTRKSVILSTGIADFQEIRDAVKTARLAGAKGVKLMKCVSAYPADPADMNLRTILDMKCRFKCEVGLSDHTMGMGAPIAATVLGATMIEKHFILSRRTKTPDSFFSMEPAEMKELVRNIRIAEQSLGETNYVLTGEARHNRAFARSLFAIRDICKGERFTEDNIRSIRPGYGLMPKYLKYLIGKRAPKGFKKGAPLTTDVLNKYRVFD